MSHKFLLILCLVFTAVIASAQNTTVCEGEDIYLVIDIPTGASIQWQNSTDGINFQNIPNGTLDTMPVGPAQTNFYYRAYISGPACDPYYSILRQLIVVAEPSIANAGVDTVVTGNTIQLYATPPTVGQGMWSIISGGGGTLTNAGSATSFFTGAADSTYQLLWTVSNAPCASSSDTIEVQFQTPALPSVNCGGNILYVHPIDNAGPMAWGCIGVVAGAGSASDGEANTQAIVANCTGASAAKVCDDLVAYGYSDWYLPSYDELECMRLDAVNIGGFSNDVYWSSTEGTGIFSANARYRTFPSGVSGYGSKSNTNRVRCVRK